MGARTGVTRENQERGKGKFCAAQVMEARVDYPWRAKTDED